MELQSVQQLKAKPIRVALKNVQYTLIADGEEVIVEKANGEEDEDSDCLNGEQSEVVSDEEIKDMEEVAGKEQEETLPETWGSRLRPRKSQGRLQI